MESRAVNTDGLSRARSVQVDRDDHFSELGHRQAGTDKFLNQHATPERSTRLGPIAMRNTSFGDVVV